MKVFFSLLITFVMSNSWAQHAIIGGDNPDAEKYPWMCSIILDYPLAGCGASLIRPQWVLTAAHCELSDFGINCESVLINSLVLDLDELEPYSELIDIEEFIVHEGYDNGTGTGPDIALIRLAEPSTIIPIALADGDDAAYYEHGDAANVLGWGTTLDADESNVLLHASCRFFGDSECADKYALSASDPSYYDLNEGGNICAGYFEGEDPAGAAEGDSGGPLFYEDGDGEFVQVGVVSGGESNITEEDFPGVFTLVTEYLDWIETTIADYELAASLEKENRENLSIVYFADDRMEIKGLDETNLYEINACDSRGVLVQDQVRVDGVTAFDVSVGDYAKGMYILNVLNQTTGMVTVKKFIVQ